MCYINLAKPHTSASKYKRRFIKTTKEHFNHPTFINMNNTNLGLINPVSPDESVSSNLSKRTEDKVWLASSLKLEGNKFFKQENLKEAIRHYHR